MKIWVDADATPVVIKEILYRAAGRTGIPLTLVANQRFQVPDSPLIDFLLVEHGFDVADTEIAGRMNSGDLVITADIPLAAEVLARGAHALNPRGEMYSVDTIRSRLNMRDFMETLRSGGLASGGPPPLGQSDRKAFAAALDQFLTKTRKVSPPDSRG
jgi:uncharacterized protein YaiI (UPF0178 family)